MDAAVGISAGAPARTWSEELRATLVLAWPLILSNLTFAFIQATDVVLMGWLGPRQLAASALGINLTWPLGFAAFGIITAAAPMMATALGAKTRSVRDVRRTFRQSLWLCAFAAVPLWLLLWNAEPVMLALGQQPELARDGGIFLRGYMWTLFPWLLFQAMRNFLAAVERPGWVLAISAVGVVANALLGWALIFGRLGLPELGIFGGGLASSIVWSLIAIAVFVVIVTDRQFRRFHLFGNWWRADWQRLGHMLKLGVPIGFAFAFEGAVFGAAAYLMGLIDADSLAGHAIALQIAALAFMVPWGHRRDLPDLRWRAGRRCRHAARPARHARTDVVRLPRLLGHRTRHGRVARFLARLGRRRHLDRFSSRSRDRFRPDAYPLDLARTAGADCKASLKFHRRSGVDGP